MRISALSLEALAKWGRFKLMLLLALFAICYLAFTNPVHAQTTTTTAVGTTTTKSSFAPDFNPDVPRDQHSYIQATMIEVMSSMICQLSGSDPIRKDHKCLGVDSQTGKIGFTENGGGAIGTIGLLMSYTFTKPVGSGDYVGYLANNFGIAKKTFAADKTCANDPRGKGENGIGYCGIKPLISIWIAMRNIAYLLFVLIFVLIGLAIMFRVHIDPRTVMTIENQIPKIILGILLVTFSFAIAGLLIDVMYVSIYLISGVLLSASPHAINLGPEGLNGVVTSPTPFDVINRLWPGEKGVGGGFGELSAQGSNTVRELIMNVLGGPGKPEINSSNAMNLTPGILDVVGGGFTGIVGLIVGLLAALFIFIGLIYVSIRLWIVLIVAYISILLDVVFAPFWFLIGLFPGSTLGVGAWFKDMLANLAVFPTAISMFVLAKVFSEIARANADKAFFVPPLAGGGTLEGNVFAGIIALGFLFMTPNVIQITRGAIKAPNVNYGPVFAPVGAAAGAVKGGVALTHTAQYDPLDTKGKHRGTGRVLSKLLG